MELVLAHSSANALGPSPGTAHRLMLSVPQTPVLIQSKPDHLLSEEDKRKCRHIGEMINAANQSTVRSIFGLVVSLLERANKILVVFRPLNPEQSLLQMLLDHFRSEVNLSISIKYSQDGFGEPVQLVSLKGLLVQDDDNNFQCAGTVNTPITALNPSWSVYVKIVAHFENSGIQPPVPSTNMPSSTAPSAKMILEAGCFSDVTIRAANGAEIKAHKSFLTVGSPVLQAMFKTDMEESQTGLLDMSDVSELGIWTLLRYLYYGDLSVLNTDADIHDIAFNTLYAANKYQVPDLEAEAISCLTRRKNDDFSVGLAFKIYMFARNVESLVGVKAKMIQILKTKLNELKELEAFQELFKKTSNLSTTQDVFMDFAGSPCLTLR